MIGGFVHIIDDDPAVRDSVTALLAAAGHAVRAYPSALAFLEGLPAAPPGCVLTDVQMPEMSGLELLAALAGRQSEFAVVVLTGRGDVPMAVEALKNGASDFLLKPYEPQALLDAVDHALSRLRSAQGMRRKQMESAERLAALTGRERDVLQGLAAGASNKEIAKTLSISPRTVESYRANIMLKTKSASLSELLRLVLASEGEL